MIVSFSFVLSTSSLIVMFRQNPFLQTSTRSRAALVAVPVHWAAELRSDARTFTQPALLGSSETPEAASYRAPPAPAPPAPPMVRRFATAPASEPRRKSPILRNFRHPLCCTAWSSQEQMAATQDSQMPTAPAPETVQQIVESQSHADPVRHPLSEFCHVFQVSADTSKLQAVTFSCLGFAGALVFFTPKPCGSFSRHFAHTQAPTLTILVGPSGYSLFVREHTTA